VGEPWVSPTLERWATFDCYGTLIDWNGGISRELVRLCSVTSRAVGLLERYHELEPQVQAEDPERKRTARCLTVARSSGWRRARG